MLSVLGPSLLAVEALRRNQFGVLSVARSGGGLALAIPSAPGAQVGVVAAALGVLPYGRESLLAWAVMWFVWFMLFWRRA